MADGSNRGDGVDRQLGDKIGLLIKAMNLSRGRVAALLGIDKSVVGRWVSGAMRPSEHNLTRLTELARKSWPQFTLASWEMEDGAFAAAVGLDLPAAEAAAVSAAALLPGVAATSRREVARDGAAYPGLYRALCTSFTNTGCAVANAIRIDRRDGALTIRAYNGRFSYRGMLFLLRGQVHGVLEQENRHDEAAFVILNGVAADRAMYLDGILLAVASDRTHTPGATVLAFERVADIDSDADARWDELCREMDAAVAAEVRVADLPAPLADVLRNTPSTGDLLRVPATRSISSGEVAQAVKTGFAAAFAKFLEPKDAAGDAAAPGRPARPAALSIAVLPFSVFGGDAALEAGADGIVEDLITGLSRAEGMVVSSRVSAFALKDRKLDIREAASVLGVRYVVEGSLRRAGGKLRLTAQLIEASTASHIWASAFDGELDDFTSSSNAVIGRIVAAVHNRLLVHDGARRAEPASIEESLSQARTRLFELSETSLGAAVALCEGVLGQQPENARAHQILAMALGYQAHLGFAADWRERLDRAQAAIRRALTLDPAGEFKHLIDGAIAYMRRDHARAVVAFERALAINPHLHMATGHLGVAHAWGGRADEAIPLVSAAIEAYPLDPEIFLRHFAIALAHFNAGRAAEARVWVMRSLQDRRECLPAQLLRAACLGAAGERDAARDAVAELRQLFPRPDALDLERLPFGDARHRAAFAEALARAGCAPLAPS